MDNGFSILMLFFSGMLYLYAGLLALTKDPSLIPRQEKVRTPDAKAYARRVLEHAISLRDEASGDRYRDVVRLAIDYIEDHYADDELSLNTLAAHVSFSPNHLSAVFRQETGLPPPSCKRQPREATFQQP